MKKLIYFFLAIILFVGCAPLVKIFSKTKKISHDDFSVVKNVVFYKGKAYAELQAMTWSLDGGELVREMNFKLLDKEDLEVMGGMIDYLSERHRGDEIEIEFEVEHNSERFKL